MHWVNGAGGVERRDRRSLEELGVDPSDTLDAIEADISTARSSRRRNGRRSRKLLAQGGKTDREQADRFARLATLAGRRADRDLSRYFLHRRRARRANPSSQRRSDAGLAERLADEQSRVCALLERRRAVACRDRSAALLTVAHEVLTRYAAEKERRGLLDYDDLIDKALTLLSNVDAAWVHLQARSRHRPCADRRGAGHQPQAVGDRAPADRPNSPPAPARAASRARCSRSATRSSRSIRSRTPRPRNSPRCGAISAARTRRAA